MCVFCMIACAMVFLIKGVQHGIVFPSTLSVTEDVFESWHSLRPSTWLVPTPPLFPPHTLDLPKLSVRSPRFFLQTHTNVSTPNRNHPASPALSTPPTRQSSPLKGGQNAQQSIFCSLCLIWKFLR